MELGLIDVGFRLLAVLALVLANGFFVAAEFSLISVRKTRIDQLLAEGSRLARPVRRALNNPDQFIAATQLGITMASLGLGWIGEPALASMVFPLFERLPISIAITTAHSLAVAMAFIIITCSASSRRKLWRCSIRKKPRCSWQSRPSSSCERSSRSFAR